MNFVKVLVAGLSCVVALAILAEQQSSRPARSPRRSVPVGPLDPRIKLPNYFAVLGHAPRSACFLN